jgi:hypothetical protein
VPMSFSAWRPDVIGGVCRYGRIWEYLRREFDVETRFETIEDKVRVARIHLFMPTPHHPLPCWKPQSRATFVVNIRASTDVIALQLELVQSSLKYFLELRQHSKSDTLEWVGPLPPCPSVHLRCCQLPRHLIGSLVDGPLSA